VADLGGVHTLVLRQELRDPVPQHREDGHQLLHDLLISIVMMQYIDCLIYSQVHITNAYIPEKLLNRHHLICFSY